MADYRTLKTSTWQDAWFIEQDAGVQIGFVFLCTNPATTPSGLYEMPDSLSARYLNIEPKEWARRRDAIAAKGAGVFEGGWVLLPKYIKHQPSPNPKTWTSILRQLMECPENLVRKWLETNACRVPATHLEPMYSLCIAYAYPMDRLPGVQIPLCARARAGEQNRTEQRRTEQRRTETTRAPNAGPEPEAVPDARVSGSVPPPSSILEAEATALGMDASLPTFWATHYEFAPAWIAEALEVTTRNGKRGKAAASYALGVLRQFKERGGPDSRQAGREPDVDTLSAEVEAAMQRRRGNDNRDV